MKQKFLRYHKDLKILAFDFETEDLNLFDTNPFQLGYVIGTLGDFPDLDKLRTFDYKLFWSDLKMSKDAARITGFRHKDWKAEARDPKEVLEEFNDEALGVDLIGGHNIMGFDRDVYRNACLRAGVTPLSFEGRMYDTLAVLKGLKMDRPYRQGEDFIAYQFKWIHNIIRKRGFATLKAAADYFDVKTDESKLHDALYDIMINFNIICKSLWKVDLTVDFLKDDGIIF